MKARAVITTKWDGKNYRPFTVRAIESYYVDSALDTDSDQWSIEIGDPDSQLSRLFERDSEIRVQLFGVADAVKFLATGIADDVSLSDDGVIRLTGRDMSSLATDSTLTPGTWKHVRADALIVEQAQFLGMKGPFKMASSGVVKKLQRSDGSESYWEFWYRLVRKEKMWLWCDPDGALNMSGLNYTGKVKYYIGAPPKTATAAERALYLPVASAELHKTTTSRVASCMVFFHRGNWGDLVIGWDSTIDDWLRKPNKVMLDVDARTGFQAGKMAYEEIFEGKVGSIEHTVTIPVTNQPIRQNEIAYVNIPDRGLAGEYFVVGVRYIGDNTGFMQQVRLREKLYALTRRIPPDPKTPTPGEPKDPVAGGIGAQMSSIRWINYFVAAAKKHHGPWNFSLFLATLIAICEQETGFANVRANGGPGGDHVEWYPPPTADPQDTHRHPDDQPTRTLEQWRTLFANEPGTYVNSTFAVGPMQLYSLGYKNYADDLMRAGFRNQFSGGRWHPEHNIMAAAYALRDKLKLAVHDVGQDDMIWAGVSYYGHHYADETPNTVPTRYAREVRYKVMTDPGYLQMVRDAIKAAADAQNDRESTDSNLWDTGPRGDIPGGLPNERQALQAVNNLKSLGQRAGPDDYLRALVGAAMYAYYNRDQVDYTQESPRGRMYPPPPGLPTNTDCSGFTTWCYHSAKLPDPSGLNYRYIGTTVSQVAHGKVVARANQLSPGDLIFYGGTPSSPGHVSIYVGHGDVVSHGQDAGPLLYAYNTRADIVAMRRYI